MNKTEFINYIAQKHSCSKVEAGKIVSIFISSIISALGEGHDVTFIGFGKFYSSKVAARDGRNPQNGESIHIPAYIQPKFSPGQNLKSMCNEK